MWEIDIESWGVTQAGAYPQTETLARSRDDRLGPPRWRPCCGFPGRSFLVPAVLPAFGYWWETQKQARLSNKYPLCSLWLDHLLVAGQRLINLNSRDLVFLDIINSVGGKWTLLISCSLMDSLLRSGGKGCTAASHFTEESRGKIRKVEGPHHDLGRWVGKNTLQSELHLKTAGGWEEGAIIGIEPKRRQESKIRQQMSKGSLEED